MQAVRERNFLDEQQGVEQQNSDSLSKDEKGITRLFWRIAAVPVTLAAGIKAQIFVAGRAIHRVSKTFLQAIMAPLALNGETEAGALKENVRIIFVNGISFFIG